MRTRDERLKEEEGTGKDFDRWIWELANQSVRLVAFQLRPARKAGKRIANILPSRRAAVNNAGRDSASNGPASDRVHEAGPSSFR